MTPTYRITSGFPYPALSISTFKCLTGIQKTHQWHYLRFIKAHNLPLQNTDKTTGARSPDFVGFVISDNSVDIIYMYL